MPKAITLDVIKTKLPSFVQIIDSSYRGIRYKAEFIDTEFNEPFTSKVSEVIKLQHGCKSRAKQRKSYKTGKRITEEEFVSKLPSYLRLIPNTWKGLRNKARFYDIEYQVEFEMIAGNTIGRCKGYCKERALVEFRKTIIVPVQEIQTRLNTIYGIDFVEILVDSYVGTNKPAIFDIKNSGTVKCRVDSALKGELSSNRGKRLLWRTNVLKRDNYKCQITGRTDDLHAHHIFSKSSCPERQFDESNGIILTGDIHREFHSIYGKIENTLDQLKEFIHNKSKI